MTRFRKALSTLFRMRRSAHEDGKSIDNPSSKELGIQRGLNGASTEDLIEALGILMGKIDQINAKDKEGW